jgi:hypothetical protein
MNNTVNRQLERINIENIIWLIYFFLIGFNLYSNYLEAKYLSDKDIESRERFRYINEMIFFISLIIYLYFLYLNWQDITSLDSNSSPNRVKLTTYSFIASILFVLAGILALYVACNIKVLDNESEIGFI